jgi:hypothetical protein
MRSESYQSPTLLGLKVNAQDPFQFDFIVDTGNGEFDAMQGQELLDYFLGVLAIPREDLWVNLSPYEGDTITSNSLGQTALGRDLLAQDYVLKQLAASLTYPETEQGKKYWDEVNGDTYRSSIPGTHTFQKKIAGKVYVPDPAVRVPGSCRAIQPPPSKPTSFPSSKKK